MMDDTLMRAAAKEKAKEIVEKYWNQIYYGALKIIWDHQIGGKPNLMLAQSVSCALLEVEAILDTVGCFGYVNTMYRKEYYDGGRRIGEYDDADKFWGMVKQETDNIYPDRNV